MDRYVGTASWWLGQSLNPHLKIRGHNSTQLRAAMNMKCSKTSAKMIDVSIKDARSQERKEKGSCVVSSIMLGATKGAF